MEPCLKYGRDGEVQVSGQAELAPGLATCASSPCPTLIAGTVFRTCDGRKSNKNVLAHENSFPRSPPEKSEDYLIVHPHLDEWSVHLDFDRFERVVPKGGDSKGKKTIDVCGIHALNNARLANHFSPDKSGVAEEMIEKFFELKRKSSRVKLITFLQGLAGTSEAARLVVESLQAEL